MRRTDHFRKNNSTYDRCKIGNVKARCEVKPQQMRPSPCSSYVCSLQRSSFFFFKVATLNRRNPTHCMRLYDLMGDMIVLYFHSPPTTKSATWLSSRPITSTIRRCNPRSKGRGNPESRDETKRSCGRTCSSSLNTVDEPVNNKKGSHKCFMIRQGGPAHR